MGNKMPTQISDKPRNFTVYRLRNYDETKKVVGDVHTRLLNVKNEKKLN